IPAGASLFPYTTLFRSAAELGVSRATLYRWVGTKEQLLGEVLWTFAQNAIRDARAAARGSGPDYLADSIQHYMRAASEFEPVTRSEEHTSELQSPCNLV